MKEYQKFKNYGDWVRVTQGHRQCSTELIGLAVHLPQKLYFSIVGLPFSR